MSLWYLSLTALVEADVAVGAAAAGWRVRRQDLTEGVPELSVEDRIDDRVEGRVRVSQPCQNLKQSSFKLAYYRVKAIPDYYS